jgi:hypothetical protein
MGGENADGAEPAGGRAKQHLSESTDTHLGIRFSVFKTSRLNVGRLFGQGHTMFGQYQAM